MHEDPNMRRLIVNRRNESGESILYCTILRHNEKFLKLILQDERPKMNLIENYTFNSDRLANNRSYKSYMHHVALAIVRFYRYEKPDRKLFDLIEQNGYPVISYRIRKFSMAKVYVNAFKRLESPSVVKNFSVIKKLRNRWVLFQNKSDSNYRTLLVTTVLSNKLAVVKYLIEDLNDDVHAVSYPFNYKTYICHHWSFCNSIEHQKIYVLDDFIVGGHVNLEMLQYLIDTQVRLFDAKNFNRIARLPEHLCCQCRLYIDNNEELCKYIFDMAMKHHLHDINFVEFLFSLSAWNSNRYDSVGYASLHCCSQKGHDETIRVLCDSGRVDVELPTQNTIIYLTIGSRTPVGLAIEEKHFSSARLLIESYNASSYEYLLILLVDALQNLDAA
ncbi:unnamed protein product [Rotaria sp. Silwood2]|nr:unnamed protein product [Rotaria sp. Silwood2]CAF4040772.1 unnamed protein product [Rotaria sp. Silwood2]CAF4079543.1 unnamed protein product [Rotaria sp. Silwood2]CAF4099596.1 unnamed protein product [Rotaria sp. Silwood2]